MVLPFMLASVSRYLLLFVMARTYLIVKNIVGIANKPVEGFGFRVLLPRQCLECAGYPSYRTNNLWHIDRRFANRC